MVNKNELIECPELSEKFTILFSSLRIWKDGRVYQIKELVGQEFNLKLYVYPKDHNPPHFHVRSTNGEIDVSFNLNDGEYMGGEVKNPNDLKKIRYLYERYRPAILKKWEEFNSKK